MRERYSRSVFQQAPRLLLCCFLLPLAAAPVIREIHPRGAQRGTAFQLTLRGDGLTAGLKLQTSLPAGLTRMVPGEVPDRPNTEAVYLVQLKKDLEPGLYPIRVQTDDGISNVMLFSVGILPETEEREIKNPKPGNGTIAGAETLAVPAVVNGTLAPADIDFYTISAKAGEKLVFEAEARRAGSGIDPVIDVLDAAGQLIATNNDAPGLGVDARMEVKFARAGQYHVRVRDARYSEQAQNFYRLKIGAYPFAESIFPMGAQRGTEAGFTLSGGNLPAPVKVKQKIEHAFQPVYLPGSASLPFLITASDTAAAAETAGLREGVMLDGLLAAAGETDRYTLAVAPGEQWMVELTGAPQLDALISVLDPAGKKLASRDDVGGADPALPFTVPPNVREVTVVIEDILRRGGDGFGYRLAARRQPPDFTLELATPFVNIPAGGTGAVTVAVQRRGYDGPIELRIPNLPEGYTVRGGNVPPESAAQDPFMRDPGFRTARSVVTITAAEGAGADLREVQVIGIADTPHGRITRTATGPGLVTAIGGLRQSPFTAPWLGIALPIAISKPLPASLAVPVPLVRIAQGFEYQLNYSVRKQPSARMIGRVNNQQIGGVGNLRVNQGPAAKSPDSGSVLVATNFATPATTFDMLFTTQVEVDGKPVTIAAPAVAVQVVPGYELQLDAAKLDIRPGARFEIRGNVRREPTFEGDLVRIQAEDLPAGVKCEAFEVPGDQRTFSLPCEAAPSAAAGAYDFRLSSTAPNVGRKAKDDYKVADSELKLNIAGAVQAAR